MANNPSRIPPFKVTRRTWVKLYCQEWLTGTTRFQFTPEQRALWSDLLALAGNSRYPGVIAAGETNGKYTAYPIPWLAATLNYTTDSVSDNLKMFVEQDRIRMEDGVIFIQGWDKYQSEYQRQAPYRKGVKGKVTERLPVEAEADADADKKQRTVNSTADSAALGSQFKSVQDKVNEVYQALEGSKPNGSSHKLEALLRNGLNWNVLDQALSSPSVIAKLKSKDYPVSALVDSINEGYIEGWLSKAGRVDKRRIKPAPPAETSDTKPVLTDEETFEEETVEETTLDAKLRKQAEFKTFKVEELE